MPVRPADRDSQQSTRYDDDHAQARNDVVERRPTTSTGLPGENIVRTCVPPGWFWLMPASPGASQLTSGNAVSRPPSSDDVDLVGFLIICRS
jgi:hypothetical protein